MNQLVWEKNEAAGKAWQYTYDLGGNILTKTEYDYANGMTSNPQAVSYTYGNAAWGDLLTAYDGQPITYDGLGNPTSYRGWTMTWQGGRQLAGMTNGTDTLSFAYNEAGLRTEKTINNVTRKYIWNGENLLADIGPSDAFYFHYNSGREMVGYTYKTANAETECILVKNLQGDVEKVIATDGTVLASYTYDAWGKVLTSTGSLANANPIRYRGYYYDTETNLYYLQSRFYDPQVGRFVNADGFTSTGQGIIGCNMFAYCMNNPILYSDPYGKMIVAVVPLIILIVSSMLSGCGSSDSDEFVVCRNREINCYGYAMGYLNHYEGYADPGMKYTLSITGKVFPINYLPASVDVLKQDIINDLDAYGFEYDVIASLESISEYQDDRIIMAAIVYPNGEGGNDFHVAMLLHNGEWADKMGFSGNARHGKLTLEGNNWTVPGRLPGMSRRELASIDDTVFFSIKIPG